MRIGLSGAPESIKPNVIIAIRGVVNSRLILVTMVNGLAPSMTDLWLSKRWSAQDRKIVVAVLSASRKMIDKNIATEFCDDDPSYLRWVSDNSHGYVLNVRAVDDPGYMVVHRASCGLISVKRDKEAYTGRAYRKVCALSVAHLRSWACLHGRPDGSFSKACGLCRPI